MFWLQADKCSLSTRPDRFKGVTTSSHHSLGETLFPSSASIDEHCISVMSLVRLLCPGEKGLSAAAFPDPLQARSQIRSLVAWSFMGHFHGLSSAPASGQRDNHCADCRALGDNGTFRRGVLGHLAVLPSASYIQLPDMQLSQVQMKCC